MCSGGNKTDEGHGESSRRFRFGTVERDRSGTRQAFHDGVHRREQVPVVLWIAVPLEELIPDVHGSHGLASMLDHVPDGVREAKLCDRVINVTSTMLCHVTNLVL